MINLIVGVKGTGKTKRLIEDVNKAVSASHGVVVCIEYGKKLTYDIKYQVRLIDAKDYNIKDGKSLYGFVCGILAGNYDVSELFIDSALKICQDDMASFEKFVATLKVLSISIRSIA
ncbi:MAG TPA: hypothetical protein PLT66_05775 [Bacillota bacterium]|nr:hypothetical protein [Bacillota bacterium]